MSTGLVALIAGEAGAEAAPGLRIRIFRPMCVTTAILALGVAVPLNLLQDLPFVVHAGTAAVGLAGAIFAWLSARGRNHPGAFLATVIALLDLTWFWNAGTQGSITYFFLPVLVFSLALFRGRLGLFLTAVQLVNLALLVAAESAFPGWVKPFVSERDRLIDLSGSLFAAFVATALITSIIRRAYDYERRQLSESAEKLRASEQRHRAIFNATSDAMFVHTADGRLLDCNDRACELFEVSRDATHTVSFDQMSAGESPYSGKEAREKIALALQGTPQTFEWLSRRFTGEVFWSEVAVRAAKLGDLDCVISSVRDATARKLVQHELLANEERLRLAMLASHQGWFEINLQTGTGISSPEHARHLGYEPAEFVSSLDNWLANVHPDDRAAAERELKACMATGETRATEYRRRTKTGEWKWIRSVGRVVDRDAKDRPMRLIGMHTDITERKELEAQLLHSQRLEAVGTLASGVAHDLNNILTPMLMGAGLLEEKLADPEDRETLAMMEATGRRGAAIVRQLLAFSRAVTPERQPIAPAELVREVAKLVRSSFPKEITVVEEIGENACRIDGDSTQLHQVLINLAVNARDAMPDGGTLTLGVENCVARAPSPEASAAGVESFLVLRVADTGHGIAPEIRERIFDPFFTTKEPGKGTGLGLATVHGIVAAHRGFIRFESTPGRGTEFRVYLPLAGGAPAPAKPVAPPESRSTAGDGGSRATILLVDDEPAVLRTTRRMLERAGYEVLASANGAEALQVMRERAAEVSLVITDFMMPEMDGPTLVPRLREIAPDVKIIGVSGLDQTEQIGPLRLVGMIAKPFDGPDLMAAVRQALSASPPAG